MSPTTLFIIGSIVFAITVYGAVMAGGLKLTRDSIIENPQYRRRVPDDSLEGLPTDVKF